METCSYKGHVVTSQNNIPTKKNVVAGIIGETLSVDFEFKGHEA